eukprot:359047-Chlamydomonas_euryale.AAC.5
MSALGTAAGPSPSKVSHHCRPLGAVLRSHFGGAAHAGPATTGARTTAAAAAAAPVSARRRLVAAGSPCATLHGSTSVMQSPSLAWAPCSCRRTASAPPPRDTAAGGGLATAARGKSAVACVNFQVKGNRKERGGPGGEGGGMTIDWTEGRVRYCVHVGCTRYEEDARC